MNVNFATPSDTETEPGEAGAKDSKPSTSKNEISDQGLVPPPVRGRRGSIGKEPVMDEDVTIVPEHLKEKPEGYFLKHKFDGEK